MRIVRASFAGTDQGPAQEHMLALVSDLIWARTAPIHGLEHLRAKASDEGMDIYLFLRAASEDAALDQAHAILAAARAPLVRHGYQATATYR
ncbi:hypothetical protein ACFXDJ_10350 [Streptomyces sp. NPDC059443]|uniref:hypothetical protein n=1 Tax=unclassified Streptomyces TaxID=2593676 RepID=UPI003693D27A